MIKAKTLDDVLQIRDQAEALRVYIKAAAEGIVAANAAAEIKLRAERKAGEMLKAMENQNPGPKPKLKPGPNPNEIGNTMLPISSLDDLGVTKIQSSRWQQEASVPEEKFTEFLEDCRDNGKEVTQAGLLNLARGNHVAKNSGENEWYTPPVYIEAAREVMGSIDLDPASCDTAQEIVKAKIFYCAEDDGTRKPWGGNVWLNPPYSKDWIGEFVEKLYVEHVKDKRVKQAIVLVNNATETAWFQRLLVMASAVCFICGRIKFLDKSGTEANTPLQGQIALYIGNDPESFMRGFSEFGAVFYY